ncbi:hypothetical protein BDW62DRAFT_8418 [Aspergillus aurantiobrunneus]
MVLVSEVIDGIQGLCSAWILWSDIDDAPEDITSAFVRVNIRLAHFQGWITVIQRADLNEEQLRTINSSVLPGLNSEIRATIDQIETFQKEAGTSLLKKTTWTASQKRIVEKRLQNLDKALNEGDELFRKWDRRYHGMADSSSRDDSGPPTEPPDPDDALSSGGGNIESRDGWSSPRGPGSTDGEEMESTASSTAPVAPDVRKSSPEGANIEDEDRIRSARFFNEFSNVFDQVEPWECEYLREKQYEPGSHEDSFYKLISSLRARSAVRHVGDTQSDNPAGFGLQQWLRAGAWYLALARTLLLHRGQLPGYNISPLVYGPMVKAGWVLLTVKDLLPATDDKEENTHEQEKGLSHTTVLSN